MGYVGLAFSALSAIGQIQQGKAAQKEANYNAMITESQIGLIDTKAGIERVQYERLKAQTMSSGYARMAKSGLMPSGSPMAVMLDTVTQINMDQAVGQYNFKAEKVYKQAEADAMRRGGKQAVANSYMGALTTMGQGIYNYSTRLPTNTNKKVQR
jgi:hypothetical protein